MMKKILAASVLTLALATSGAMAQTAGASGDASGSVSGGVSGTTGGASGSATGGATVTTPTTPG
ncbi:MAG: hypothetical protein E5Y51_25600, partial [Mesorhizobium sp.]